MENQTTNAIALREPMQLTSENVEAVFKDCLAESAERATQVIRGVVIQACFNRDKVTANRDNILSMLSCLPHSRRRRLVIPQSLCDSRRHLVD